MTKRIKQLAKEAAREMNETGTYSEPKFQEKFAELIVLECSSICYKGLENGDEAASLLMNTFGVEE